MAENQRIVNLPEIIENAVEKLLTIEARDDERRKKNQAQKRLAESTITKLYTDKRHKAKSHVKLTTLNNYLSKIRKALVKADVKHWRFESQIIKVAKKFSGHTDRLTGYLGMTVNDILSDLATLRTSLKEDMINHKEGSSEHEYAKGLFNELAKVNIVPPVVMHMSLNKADRELFKAHQSEKIEQKKSEQVSLDLDSVRALAIDLMTTEDGEPKQTERLALGIALASGRRQVEVCLAGGFEAVRGDKYAIKFSGQVKAKGLKSSYKIPTLVPAKLVLDAVKKLRSTKYIADISERVDAANIDDKAYAFNNGSRNLTSVASNVFTKSFGLKPTLNGETVAWTFKDSRAIYAKSAYRIWSAEQKAAGKPSKDEGLFFTENLGHEDKEAQNNYKSFDITSESTIKKIVETTAKVKSKSRTPEQRLKALKAFSKTEVITDSKAFTKYTATLVDLITEQPETEINQAWLRKNVGGKAINLKALFELIDSEKLARV